MIIRKRKRERERMLQGKSNNDKKKRVNGVRVRHPSVLSHSES